MTQADLDFSLLPPEPKAEKPSERKRLNAAALRVLAFLKARGASGATNVELSAPHVGGLRAVGRVHELREDGWDIEKMHVSGGTWSYRVLGLRK